MHEEKGAGGVGVWFLGGCAQWSGKLSRGSRLSGKSIRVWGLFPAQKRYGKMDMYIAVG